MSTESAAVHDLTEPVPARGPRPWLAALLDVIVPPVGHLYAGELRRGIVIWFAAMILILLALSLLMTRVPGAFAIFTVAMVALVPLLPADAYRRARRARDTNRPRPRRHALAYLGTLALSLAVGAVFSSVSETRVKAFRMPALSMSPTLLLGDYIFVNRAIRPEHLARGDLVTFPYPVNPAHAFMKRVVGLPNETIEVRDRKVFVDGTMLDEPYAFHGDPVTRTDARDQIAPFRLGPTEVFLLGDNRDNSNDSRFFGPVDVRTIDARAAVIYWSWDPERSRPRWARIGRRLDEARRAR